MNQPGAPTVTHLPAAGLARDHPDPTPIPVSSASSAFDDRRSAFVPLTLCALALVVFFASQCVESWNQRQAMQAAHQSQQQTVDNASRLRASLDALGADTQRLADGGNANAALLVTELRRRGITITLPGAALAPTVAASR